MRKPSRARAVTRRRVKMTLVSHLFPSHQAEVLDLSEGGARIRLKSAPNKASQVPSFSFDARFLSQFSSVFAGRARVAWVSETLDGFEAGLEWESLTSQALSGLKSALLT